MKNTTTILILSLITTSLFFGSFSARASELCIYADNSRVPGNSNSQNPQPKHEKELISAAFSSKNIGKVKNLLQQGVNPNIVGRNNIPIILPILEFADLPLLQLYFDKGGILDAKKYSKEIRTSIIKNRNVPVLEYLVQKNYISYDVFKTLKLDDCILTISANMLRHLVDKKCFSISKQPQDVYRLLHRATQSQRHMDALLRYLIDEEGLDPNVLDFTGVSILQYAVASCSFETFVYLIEKKGCNPKHISYRGESIYHFIPRRDDMKKLNYLIRKYGYDKRADIWGNTPLDYSSSPTQDFFWKHQYDGKQGDKYLPFFPPAQTPDEKELSKLTDLETVKRLLDKGTNMYVGAGFLNRVPLIACAARRRAGKEIFYYLIDEKKYIMRSTPPNEFYILFDCILEGDFDIFKKCIMAGARVNVSDVFGYTVFSRASRGGDHDIEWSRFLVENGANVNIPDKRLNQTPLHTMAFRDFKSSHLTIELILKNGGNPHIPDFNGKLPVDYAKDPKVIALLRDAMKKTPPPADMRAVFKSSPKK